LRWFLIRFPFYFRKTIFIKEEKESTITKGSDNIASSKARENNLENKRIRDMDC